jgi:hypothetical protein
MPLFDGLDSGLRRNEDMFAAVSGSREALPAFLDVKMRQLTKKIESIGI